jgi:hypothetical protein
MVIDVADAVIANWPVEEIPDASLLFMRVHRNNLYDDGTPKPAAYRDHGDSMSTDWDKYSTPGATRARLRPEQTPLDYAVIAMPVGGVREIPGQSVIHEPLFENRAHPGVFGNKRGGDPETRFLFRNISTMVVPYIPLENADVP